MNKFFQTLTLLATTALFASACAARTVQAGEEKYPAAPYKSVLGQSAADQAVTNFIISNNCHSASQFRLCKDIGMALWINSNQLVETVYLYLNNREGFVPYKGELPFGLKFYDTMAAVEYKLNRQGVGNAGLPDTGETPDHMHYRANYYQAGLTILYNSPFPDEDATLYAILVGKSH